MNKNGKGNGIFILLIPVFIIIVLVVTDTIISYTKNKTYQEVTEIVIKEVYEKDDVDNYYEEIKKLYERRGFETERLVVDYNEYDKSIYVENEHVYFGLLTSLSKRGEEVEFTLFGIEYFTFKLKKNSKTFIKVEAKYDNNEKELMFEYMK